jgi:enoyl-CoA hydratase/carnithine racemase
MTQVQVSHVDSVAILTLDDPSKRNAMSEALGDALQNAVRAVNASGARAAVLCGAGGAFSAGGDMAMLARAADLPEDEAKTFMLRFYARYLSVLDLNVPIIAAIDGAAVGAGLCLAMACDLCFIAPSAKLGLNFVKLGLHPGMAATYLAPLRFGANRASELLLSGRRFSGSEAIGYGFGMASDTPLESAKALAKEIAGNAPFAVAAVKATIGIDHAALNRVLDTEAEGQARSFRTEDFRRGIAAARAGTTAVFI